METVGLSPSESLEDFAVRSDLDAALAAGEHAMLTAGDLASAQGVVHRRRPLRVE